MAWFGRRAFESFKRYAQDTRVYPRHRMLSSGAVGEELVYEVNPVYLEAGQGGTSPMRGWGAILFVFALISGWWAGVFTITEVISSWHDPEMGMITRLFLIPFMLFAVALGTLVSFVYLGSAFFTATDVITRYDRKRQKVWMWTGRGPIEIDWNALTPVVRSGPASAYSMTRIYRGLYVEFDAQGEPKKTRGIPHVIQVGGISAGEEGVLPAMEYVRLYMEEGPQSLPPVRRYLQARPKWWAMFNFMNMIQDWLDYRQGKGSGLGPPYATMVFFFLFFPILFPMQFTNWLALKVAPCPHWPKELLRMHEQDLAELAAQAPASPPKPRPRRTPVIRVNGRIVDDATPDDP